MKVHAVILNWNGGGATSRCLSALAASEGLDLSIHVVDNGSSDGSPDRIAVEWPAVTLHRLPENRGFSVAANVGIDAALSAGADAIFLLNNDALVEPTSIATLVEAAERRPDCGLYTGKIWRDRARGILWSCGMSFGFGPNLTRLRGFDEVDRGRYDREETLEIVTGCALLVLRSVFDRIGKLDPSYFVYVEDADFCARAVRAGFRPLYVPTAHFEHPGSVSTGGGYSPVRKYLSAHGSVLWLKRHGNLGRWLGFWICDVLAWPIVLVLASFRGNAKGALAKGRGLRDGLLGRSADLSPLTGPKSGRRA